ncbi:uncharacterized protein BXZ73DRAFT_48020 [Epithele typhae]|uniref:uncharacterized protein n=1 Tax=Epithele typhae TaxID=378194 RepID=UPI0020076522|nr:uncharacterized protein BXZ73DRAFT_48020 [Epithele typhae]KAH9929604.1 hypothetical protein BXZ73DRAFT_48020 [Epithele typhae]
MGPPPSPKEPRRSGRRPAASSSKSPDGSPPSEGQPKPRDNTIRPSLISSQNNTRTKRAKNEEIEEPLEELAKNGISGNGSSIRSKRKGKDKDKAALVLQIPNDGMDHEVEAVGDEAENGEDEEGGVTRCICQKYGESGRAREEETDQGEFMVQCETCKAWQHGQCMHYEATDVVPQHYFCEECKPETWVEVIKAWAAKHTRHPSSHSHPPPTPTMVNTSRNSRSHSPAVSKTTKRRNTMNSRDAAYDEEKYRALMEAHGADFDLPPRTPVSAVSAQGVVDGHAEPVLENEPAANPKKKRKRSDDDSASVKRTRSVSVVSDRPPPSVVARDATPLSTIMGPPGPPSASSTARAPVARSKPRAGRKSQVQAQDLALVDGADEGNAAPTRKANSRAKANNTSEHTGRRAQNSAAAATAAGTSATSRSYHHSHPYAATQQPLLTSWNLPDYLAHLATALPSEVPPALEVQGSVLDANRNPLDVPERLTERGVKVKWPSKRMSVGDMNKRVRSLVEWVGREQAAAMERTRRKEALQKALQAQEAVNGEGGVMDAEASTADGAHAKENGVVIPPELPPPVGALGGRDDATMKLMEELMEELISFQERFGPGAKAKERDRRAGAL